MGEYLRLKSKHVWNTLFNWHFLFLHHLDRHTLMIIIHFPQIAFIEVFKAHPHQASSTEGTQLQLYAIIRQPNTLHLPIPKVCVYYGATGVDYEAESVGPVVFEVADVGLKVLRLQDTKAVSLVGCIHEALVNTVN